MICGGHTGRAHKKQLEKLCKTKSYRIFNYKHEAKFPSVVYVAFHCSRQKQGCGCMSDKFVE